MPEVGDVQLAVVPFGDDVEADELLSEEPLSCECKCRPNMLSEFIQ